MTDQNPPYPGQDPYQGQPAPGAPQPQPQPQMAPGWYPDPTQAGHQRQWDGQQWIGPAVPIGGAKKGGKKWLIPLIACLTLAFIAIVGGALAGSGEDEKADEDISSEEETTTTEAEEEDETTTTEAEEEETTTTEAPTTTTAPPPTTAGPTVSQENARESAQDYLEFSSFSRTGLIEQLEFEGFSTEDATWAVDSLNADWNEQAAKSAAEYLEFSSFSRQSLIDQLVFEGFTQAEAEYGVGTTGL